MLILDLDVKFVSDVSEGKTARQASHLWISLFENCVPAGFLLRSFYFLLSQLLEAPIAVFVNIGEGLLDLADCVVCSICEVRLRLIELRLGSERGTRGGSGTQSVLIDNVLYPLSMIDIFDLFHASHVTLQNVWPLTGDAGASGR